MGNSASSSRGHQEETVDYGFLSPQGVYTGTPDWNHQIVTQLIIERRLAPFYRPLEDYDENWDDEQILAARSPLPDSPDVATSESASRSEHPNPPNPPSRHGSQSNRRPGVLKEPSRLPEAMVYRGAAECPICFLYYPSNINRSRCCDQAICTECFVQIKRSEPTATHVVSEPAACPYCVQENFGVTYVSPSWRAGIGAEYSQFPTQSASRPSTQPSMGGRRKSFGADSPEVVTIDHIRPDWEAKLAAVRAAVARRANRRIIMRQVGDRLIPVGVTSGRIHPLAGLELTGALNGEEGGGEAGHEGRMSRRSRRRQQAQAEQQQNRDLNQLLGTMGLGGQDLEELMLMEAMRLSQIEYEAQQKKEAEEKRKKEGQQSSAPSASILSPIPTSAPIDVTPVHGLGTESHYTLSSRSSPLGVSFEEGSSPRSIPQDSLIRGASHSGSATPNLRETTLRKSLDAGLPSLLTSGSSFEDVIAGNKGSPSMKASVSSADAGEIPGSSTHSPGLQEHVQPVSVRVPSAPGRKDTNMSVATTASELTGGPSYDELPSSPDSPTRRPLLLETAIYEIPESGSSVGLESGAGGSPHVASTANAE